MLGSVFLNICPKYGGCSLTFSSIYQGWAMWLNLQEQSCNSAWDKKKFYTVFISAMITLVMSYIKCTFSFNSLTWQSKLCNVMLLPPATDPCVCVLAQTIKLDIQFVFLWMGFYVYVFKNKYCCLLGVVGWLVHSIQPPSLNQKR